VILLPLAVFLPLTDGRPHDVDVKDEQYLIHDARKAVQVLGRDGAIDFVVF